MTEMARSNFASHSTRPDIARKRVERFAKRFGTAHIFFAQHAAFPLMLTPSLAYRLWACFQRDTQGKKLYIPWIAVADFLLSSLCDEVSHELYEINIAVREVLLKDLQANPNLGYQRIQGLSTFLLKDIKRHLESHDPEVRDIADIQRWMALAYVQPGDTARQLAEAIRDSLEHDNKPDLLRLASLAETFAHPLAAFAPLLTYARGVGYYARGDMERAWADMSGLATSEHPVQIQGIYLPIPKQVRKVGMYRGLVAVSYDEFEKFLRNQKNERWVVDKSSINLSNPVSTKDLMNAIALKDNGEGLVYVFRGDTSPEEVIAATDWRAIPEVKRENLDDYIITSAKSNDFLLFDCTLEDARNCNPIILTQYTGRYQRRRLLGQGLMSEIWLAYDIYTKELVALKLMIAIPEDDRRNQKAFERFHREIAIASSLKHPHVLPILNYGDMEYKGRSVPFLVSPYIEDGSLADLIKNTLPWKCWTLAQTVDVIIQAAESLYYLHTHDPQITHQDVKPGNFLVRLVQEPGRVAHLYLCDFGISRWRQASTTMASELIGTFAYMAPEQVERQVDPASDQYGLAVMACYLLTGKLPLQASTPEGHVEAHLHESPRLPSQLNPERISIPEIDAVFARALAKHPQQRFPTIMAFAHALEQAIMKQVEVQTIAQAEGLDLVAVEEPSAPGKKPKVDGALEEPIGLEPDRSHVTLLPAILIGGPPHAGRSVLFYRLTQALQQRGIDHSILRACPDGEGNWYHEGKEELRNLLRVGLKEWPPAFIKSITQVLNYRNLPFLVDIGGLPKPSQHCLVHSCTHYILLVKEDQPEYTRLWQDLIETHNLLPLGSLISRREGESLITAKSPILEGVITGLERSAARTGAGAGPLFDKLIERIAALFTSFDLQEIRVRNLKRAPTELVLDVQQELRAFTTTSTSWEPSMLLPFLERLPQQTPLSVYGIGPSWLYASLAAYGEPQPFYLFDPRLPFGWVPPVTVALDTNIPQREDLYIEIKQTQNMAILKIKFPQDRLEYLQPDPLVFPPILTEQGVIIDGRLPYWLLTAITRLYKAAGVAWIASYYPPLDKAVAVYSRIELYRVGDLVEKASS